MNEQYQKDMTELKRQINSLGCDVRIAMSVSDKRIRIRNIIIVILSVLLIGSNVAWFAFEKSMETVEETTTTETTTTETYTIDQDNQRSPHCRRADAAGDVGFDRNTAPNTSSMGAGEKTAARMGGTVGDRKTKDDSRGISPGYLSERNT